MWASIMDEIISQEPTLSVRRTLDAKHCILNRWNETHDTPMDESAVMLFLCDEQCSGLTDEQRALQKLERQLFMPNIAPQCSAYSCTRKCCNHIRYPGWKTSSGYYLRPTSCKQRAERPWLPL